MAATVIASPGSGRSSTGGLSSDSPVVRDRILLPYVMSGQPNPFRIVWSGDWVVSHHLWATLVDISQDGSVAPVLAESWSVAPDGLTWIFRLRKNLKWSDGSDLTASQVVQSLQHSLKGTSHTSLSGAIQSIDADGDQSAKKDHIDEYRLTIRLRRPVPKLLWSLSYVDWAIVHPQAVAELKSKNSPAPIRLTEFPCSGPYCTKSIDSSVLSSLPLQKNPHWLNSLVVSQGQLQYFESCEELVKFADQMLSFRSYSETFTKECQARLQAQGFEIQRTQPTWILKADFTEGGLKRLSLDMRRRLIWEIHQGLKADSAPDFGVSRATGLRAPHLFGSLSEQEFDVLIEPFQAGERPSKGTPIQVVTMESWAQWKSFTWLVSRLEDFGFEVRSHVLSRDKFAAARTSKEFGQSYDLIFVPLGVGDPDPNGTWRMVSQVVYPGQVNAEDIEAVFFEPDLSRQAEVYKRLARELMTRAVMIPLKMDADFVGYHSSVRGLGSPPFRQGLTLYDLKKTRP